MRTLLFMIGLLSATLSQAQAFSYPVVKASGKDLQSFIPTRWFVKDSARGDLNGDKLPDLAVVFEYRDTVQELRPDGSENLSSPRILVVLLRNAQTDSYTRLLQNNSFITRYGEGGMSPDAYGDISITKGILTIFVQFLRGHATYKFCYQDNDLYLIGATTGGASGDTIESFDVNFITRKAKIETGNIGDEQLKTQWVTIAAKQLKKLRDMKMIMEWEVVKNFFI